MNRAGFAVRTLVFGIVLLSLVNLSFGQAISGNMVGTVVDSSGAAVANAEVTATNIATGLSITNRTNNTGEYRFDNLPIGNYKFTVKASGFRTTTELAEIVLNRTGTVNVRLAPGAVAETVEVSGEAPTIDTTTAQLQSSYDSRMSQDLGVTSAGGLGAGILNLSLLSPGVTNASAMGMGEGPSVGGQRPRDRMPGEHATAIPGLTLYRVTAPTACYAAEYETGMAVVAQGRKRVTLGRTTFLCDESTFILTSVDVPLVSEIVAASEKVPLLALFLRLDMAIVRELLDREELKQRNGESQVRSYPDRRYEKRSAAALYSSFGFAGCSCGRTVLQRLDPTRDRVPLTAVSAGRSPARDR